MNREPLIDSMQHVTRRSLFSRGAAGLGAAALASIDRTQVSAAQDAAKSTETSHHPAKARRAIYLFMSGAPSQMDLWDHKPQMADWFDKDLPDSIRQGQRLTTMTSGQSRFPIAPSIYKFSPHGKQGTMVSELLPFMAKQVDQIALVRSMYTEAINHDPAITYICTGDQLPGKASLGSWLSYGLGTENENLPAFMVMTASWTAVNKRRRYTTDFGVAGFYQVSIKVWHCVAAETRSSSCPIQKGLMPKHVVECWIHLVH